MALTKASKRLLKTYPRTPFGICLRTWLPLDRLPHTKAPAPVPLCPKAHRYIIEKGKTLPATFLETLLPPPGFLEDLNRSLQKENQVTNLLDRFEQEIRCLKCDICKLTCLGSKNLRNHMESNHLQESQPSRPDPDLPSLGDYLVSLETKIDKCTNYIIEQSVITSKQSIMIEKLLALNEAKSVKKDDDVTQFFKCGRCNFETEDRPILNNHMNQTHLDSYSWQVPFICNQCAKEFNSKDKFNRHMSENVNCPLCTFSNCSETVVAKHVEELHPETYTCHLCKNKFTGQTQLDIHVCNVHSVNSDEVKCPLCNYTNSLESIVTNHVQEQHPEIHTCSHCQSKFNLQTELESHVVHAHPARPSEVHQESSPTIEQPEQFKCDVCMFEANTSHELERHLSVNHSKTEDILLLLDSHVQTVKPRVIEKRLRGKLFTPGYTKPKEGRVYCSSGSWPNVKYPENSMDVKVMELLKVRPYRGAVMMAPCNDITNIKDLGHKEQYEMAEKSANNTVAVVKEALEAFPNLDKFLLLEYPPRADSYQLANLTEYANFGLRETVHKSGLGSRIGVGALDGLYNSSNYHTFGPTNRGPRFDGIHLRGKQGKNIFTNDIIRALESSGMTRNTSNTNQVADQEGVATSNRFTLLN